MKDIKVQLQKKVYNALRKTAGSNELLPENVIVENPPKPELGDIAFPMFPYAKILKKSPAAIAVQIAEILSAEDAGNKYSPEGPYLNITLGRENIIRQAVSDAAEKKEKYGFNKARQNEKIMVEFSCPNTNKPLHLGHLRNNSIGESISKILKFNSASVLKVNLINDRGVHICKSMLAYREFGSGTTPESENIKSDHFVGKYYIEFDKWVKKNPEAEKKAREMLLAWENGDPEVRALWSKMNKWAVDGIEETYKKTGVSFDRVYYESRTYTSGRDEILKGIEKGVFYRDDNKTVWVDLEDINLDKKVLLRGDGTSLYLTQDIGTAIARHIDWPFDTLIYVVASEQQYHFKVLFHILGKLGYQWAKNLYHLSYGMVNLPEGRMKSREGTVVDADDLIAELSEMAAGEIKNKEREDDVDDVASTAEKIALGALNYFLLSAAPAKDMIFNPADSLSFNGNTGPYLQYMGARISSILRKYGNTEKIKEADLTLLKLDEEWEIIKLIHEFPETVEEAGRELNPSILASYIYELAKKFSKYYHDYPVLNNEDKSLVLARVALCSAVRQVFENCFSLIGIPYLDAM
ncbi:MAG: arginine--tRNA ligase [Spirochaetia bacterium]|jgi:arginyl-tRNA synthetase|nr:arginine--tRNA ligase [Spirochaetia bacterium]